MFNLGFTELIALGAIALLIIGPKQLPQMARTLARTLNELKRATSGITSDFKNFKDSAQRELNASIDEESPIEQPQTQEEQASIESEENLDEVKSTKEEKSTHES